MFRWDDVIDNRSSMENLLKIESFSLGDNTGFFGDRRQPCWKSPSSHSPGAILQMDFLQKWTREGTMGFFIEETACALIKLSGT